MEAYIVVVISSTCIYSVLSYSTMPTSMYTFVYASLTCGDIISLTLYSFTYGNPTLERSVTLDSDVKI